MIYNPKLLIEELLRLNSKKQLYLKNKQSYLKNIDYLETQQHHNTNTHKLNPQNNVKIPILFTQLSPEPIQKESSVHSKVKVKTTRNKKTKIFFNDMVFTSMKELYKENVIPIKKKKVVYVGKGIVDYKKQANLRKKKKKESFSINNNKKHKETPYEVGKSKQCLYKKIILTKQILNTTSPLKGEVLRPYSSRGVRMKLSKSHDMSKINITNYSNNVGLTERSRKPQYYFNNINLKKFELTNSRLLNMSTKSFKKKGNKSYLVMTP